MNYEFVTAMKYAVNFCLKFLCVPYSTGSKVWFRCFNLLCTRQCQCLISVAVNVVITGVGADYTSLGSFGTIDAFAETLVIFL